MGSDWRLRCASTFALSHTRYVDADRLDGAGRMTTLAPQADFGAIALFRDLRPSDLTRLQSLLHCRACPSGTTLLTAEQPGEVAYIIQQGAIKVHVTQPDGREVILAILGAGEVLGEMSVVDSLGRSASATTIEDCLLCWMDRTAFWDCLQLMPAMTYNLVRILSRRLRLANVQTQSLATLDVDGRIARQIVAFAQEYGEPDSAGAPVIPFRLTQSDLADLVGASRVRVNQILVTYKRHGYISVDPTHHITVCNLAALVDQCRDSSSPVGTLDPPGRAEPALSGRRNTVPV
ncbi:MAG TPA: Crp/Fnr family transcriptional regulator [Chloroflexia bacterium]|nr:Crp/Fnr family transcriptional regulator [Chloroflexia bacterium]